MEILLSITEMFSLFVQNLGGLVLESAVTGCSLSGSTAPQHKPHYHCKWVVIIKCLKRKKIFMLLTVSETLNCLKLVRETAENMQSCNPLL